MNNSKQILISSLFIQRLIVKKKNTYVIPIIWLIISIILSIILSTLEINENVKALIFYVVIFVEMLLTILYSSIKTLNIYRDLEEEGIEILLLSKPISRKKIFLSKLITTLFFSIYFSLFISLSNLIIFSPLKGSESILLALIGFFVFIIAYLIFGNIASLIAYKANSKVAITLPLLFFSPLVIGGTVIAARSSSISDNLAFYLNSKNDKTRAGNVPNLNQYYLNNNTDDLYIIPNGLNKFKLDDEQLNYVRKSYDVSKNSSISWQTYSYLIAPYQFVDYFNYKNINIFNAFSTSNNSNLKNYLNYKNLDSFLYKYNLVFDSNLKKYEITDLENKNKQEKVNFTIGALKVSTPHENLENSDIIYAWEFADNFDQVFPDDKFVHSASDNLVGNLKWIYLKELLENKFFKHYANEFFEKFLKSINSLKIKNNISEIKNLFNKNLEKTFLDDNSHQIYSLDDPSSYILNLASLKDKKILKTPREKKIYLATALIYYAFLTYNDSKLVDAILFNVNQGNYNQTHYKVKIDGINYNIGGYRSYVPRQEVKSESEINKFKNDNSNKPNSNNENNNSSNTNQRKKVIVIRYDLNKSDNYLFQPLNNLLVLKRDKIPVVEKNTYFLIWIIMATSLIFFNNFLYFKKDYK